MLGLLPALACLPVVGAEVVVDRGVRVPSVQPGPATFDGTHFVAVWSANDRLVAARIGLGGVPLDDPPLDLPSTPGRRIFWQDVGLGVAVWLEVPSDADPTQPQHGELRAARLFPDGGVDTEAELLASDVASFILTENGSELLVAWTRSSAAEATLALMRVETTTLDVTAGPEIATAPDGILRPIALACASITCLLGYATNGDDHLALTARDGRVLAAMPPPAATSGGFAVAASDDGYLFAADVDAGHAIDVVTMDENGRAGPIAILAKPDHAYMTGAAFVDDHYLVSWQTQQAPWSHAARVDRAGEPLDEPGGFVLSSDEAVQLAACGAVRCLLTGSQGALLIEGRDIVTPAPVPVAWGISGESLPAVAEGGDVTLYVWEDDRRGYDEADIYAARVDAAGRMLDPDAIPIATFPRRQTRPRVAWTGSDFLVGWSNETVTGFDPQDAGSARVGLDGRVSDVVVRPHGYGMEVACGDARCLTVWIDWIDGVTQLRGLPVDFVPTEPMQGLALAAGPGGFLLTWKSYVVGALGETMRALRLGPDGMPRGAPFDVANVPYVLNAGSWSAGTPLVAGSPHEWLVVWSQPRQTYEGCWWQGDDRCAESDVHAARVLPSGRVLDGPDGVALESSLETAWVTGVSFTGRSWLVAWTQTDTSTCEDPLAWRCHTVRSSDVRAARLDEAGTPLDPEPFAIAASDGDQSFPSLAPIAGGARVAYVAIGRVRGRLITDDATPASAPAGATPGPSAGCGVSPARDGGGLAWALLILALRCAAARPRARRPTPAAPAGRRRWLWR